jgi:hypothetical protein
MGFGPHKSTARVPLLNDFHHGIDFKGVEGTPVQATADGTVTFAGVDGARGIAVVLQHGRGLETLYCHLAEARVKAGDKIARGTVIGTVGRTGTATGPHVHYEVRKDGEPVNPASYLKETSIGKPVSGEIHRNAEGDLEMSLKIQCTNGLKVVIIPEGETKNIGEINIGSRGGTEKEIKELKEYSPKITFKNASPGRPLHIRCAEDGGRGRWGEAIVETRSFPATFSMNLDHRPSAD